MGSSWTDVGGTTPEVILTKTPGGLDPGVLYRWRARVLRAPATGVSAPRPAHGPWRRLDGQAQEADIRTYEPGPLRRGGAA